MVKILSRVGPIAAPNSGVVKTLGPARDSARYVSGGLPGGRHNMHGSPAVRRARRCAGQLDRFCARL